MVDDPAQHLDQHHFEQAVGQQARPAAGAVGFGEQQLQGGLQPVDGLQRQHDRVRQRLHDRVAQPTVEIQRRAGEVGAVHRRIDELVVHRAWKQQQRGFAQMGARKLLAVPIQQVHFAPPQHMQEAAPGLGVEGLQPAQRAGMEQGGLDPEPLQDGAQAVD